METEKLLDILPRITSVMCCDGVVKERLPALVRDLLTFSSKVIKMFIIV
jgi:hypothetical protein